jgi:dihydrofolate synthase / folylpolyglutamate synthase
LDATNIVTPLASVITNIQFDHQKWLGETLSQIASEKAGIIKPGVPVITSEENPEALQVLTDTAARNGALLTKVSTADTLCPPLDSIQLPLLGEHQRRNAALALATIRAVSHELPVSPEAVRNGLMRVHWPGRLQVIRPRPGQTILLDGAHNPSGAETFRAAVQQHFAGVGITLVFGVLQDKDWPAMCRILAPLAQRIYLAPVGSERTAEPELLRESCRAANPHAQLVACSSLAEALERSATDEFVVITGSLHFVGEAMEVLKITAAPAQNERSLNEWAAIP